MARENVQIRHEVSSGRFTANVTGGLAELLYEYAANGALDIYSVQVPAEARGQKVAEQLVLAALAFAKSNKLRIIPTCPYVDAWFRRNPAESKILAG
jgi:predicted GNAT family acetyltransferase